MLLVLIQQPNDLKFTTMQYIAMLSADMIVDEHEYTENYDEEQDNQKREEENSKEEGVVSEKNC